MTYVLVAASYLLGATPTSYWVGRVFHGIDLREHGSGNLGATNAFRILGLPSALPVVLVDVGKGFLPVWLFPRLVEAGMGWTLAFAAAAIVGHMFSFWVGFRGGKGVATSAGVFLALAPWAVLWGFVVWVALFLPTGYVSLGSIGAAAALPLLVWLTAESGGAPLFGFTTGLALFVIWAHRTNIRRLLRGEENSFRRGARPGSDGARSDPTPAGPPDGTGPEADPGSSS